MARLIDLFTAEEVAEAMLDAAGTIKAARVLLEEKQAIERGE